MEIITYLIDFILHIDQHLGELISNYGAETYLFLFLIIFVETGVVIMPFLPGDSLIFAAAAFAAHGSLNVFAVFFIVFIAAIIGDAVNYQIGKILGNKLIKSNNKFIKKEYLEKTEHFFEKHGGKSIVLARFVPIIRTFAPFVAGMSKMGYLKFLSYNFIGAFLWVITFTIAGFFFGNIPFVKDNFSLVIIAIIFVSILPAVIGFLKGKFGKKKTTVNEIKEVKEEEKTENKK